MLDTTPRSGTGPIVKLACWLLGHPRGSELLSFGHSIYRCRRCRSFVVRPDA